MIASCEIFLDRNAQKISVEHTSQERGAEEDKALGHFITYCIDQTSTRIPCKPL